MGREHVFSKKKSSITSVKLFGMEKVSGITKKNFKIGTLEDFEKTYVLYVAMAEKPLSSGQKWFLRWVFLGFGGYFVLQSVFAFSFRWSEVPFPRYSDSSESSPIFARNLNLMFRKRSLVFEVLTLWWSELNFKTSTLKENCLSNYC